MNEVFEKICKIINEYDSFIVMGHKDPDLDSLGSCLGFCEIVEHFGKKAYLFFNDSHLENYNSNINQSFENMKKDIICINDRTYKKVEGNTLLVILDVHIKERLECPKLIDEFDVMVLDHHIKSRDYIKNTVFFYIDSNLSSASEFVSFYANYLGIDLDNVIATILLAGIEIDTNSFNVKTTSDTYKAASILMDQGADLILKQELLKETKDEYIKRASLIKNSFMLTDNTAMCVINNLTNSLELAEIAEQLLTFENVEASFTIGKLDINTIGISARSLGKIDVAKIMTKFGGGGHISNAAAQVKNMSIKEIKQILKENL